MKISRTGLLEAAERALAKNEEDHKSLGITAKTLREAVLRLETGVN